LADAVVAYQMTLLGVVDKLTHRIESHQNAELPAEAVLEDGTGNHELDELIDDFAELENVDETLKKGLNGVELDIKTMVDRWTGVMVCHLVLPHFYSHYHNFVFLNDVSDEADR